jgi:hypothetical protein
LPSREAEGTYVSVLIRRITLAALMAALVGGTFALPASSSAGPVAHAAKCKKGKKGKHKKKKKCAPAGQSGGSSLPGQATHPTAAPPSQPQVPPSPLVNAIGVASNPVLAGDSTSGQVTISDPAPAGGQSVDLESSNPARAAVPATVVVASGQTTANFPVDTTSGPLVTATLTAAIAGSSADTDLHVVSTPSVASVALEKHCFTLGSFSANRVTLDVPAPADTTVQLASSNDLALSVSPPSTTTVPAGSKIALFSVTALAPASPVTVTATLAPSEAEDSASVSLTPPSPAVTSLSIDPPSVVVGGTATGTVTLNCEATGSGTVVNVVSDLPGVAAPASSPVTIPAGQRTGTFQINTSGAGTAHISADTGSGGAQQATLHVTDLGT